MRRTMIILGILLAALLTMVACAPKEVERAPPAMPYEPTPMPPTTAEDTTPDQDVLVVDQDVVVIDDVANDLDLNDLENLDQELAELENLEI